MLIVEPLNENPSLVKYYSDSGYIIRKIGTDEYYPEATELSSTIVEYEETDILIEDEIENSGSEDVFDSEYLDMKNALELLGVRKED